MNAIYPADEAHRSGEALNSGATIYALASRIFPLCRSLTGEGVRHTLDILAQYIELERHEVSTGTAVFDWTIPPEWTVEDAFIRHPSGSKVVDFVNSNLHLMSYSIPVQKILSKNELKAHVHTLPEQPNVVPYKTAYYTDTWGICMSHNDFEKLEDVDYEVVIKTSKRPGHLVYGEHVRKGRSEKEILLYTHICHPSLANDNCSGIALLTHLAATLKARATYYTYRFVFAPGTIGALTWLSRNYDRVGAISGGLVVTCVGDGGGPNYKRSRKGTAVIDRAVSCVRCGPDDTMPTIHEFTPYGYDERQFCSPGFNLPVGLLQRSSFGTFPEYHTSADNLDFIRPEHLGASFDMVCDIIEVLEGNWIPLNLSPLGEPRLGKYDLYPPLGGHKSNNTRTMAYLWILNFADGSHSLLDIAERSSLPFSEISAAAEILQDRGLVSSLGRCEI